MEIRLDPQQGFVKDGKLSQRDVLINAGVKAAVCFKEAKNGVISPENIRNTEPEDTLIIRGINTIFNDHTTPSEHAHIGLEITGIPKILCMVLNNEHQYTTCERSLRYTEVEPNEYLSKIEVDNYNKWITIFENILTTKYYDFFVKNYGEKRANNAIHKLAQENARYHVSVFMPTTLTYTVPFIQINKVCKYMEKVINNPQNSLEERLIPYMKEFIAKLKELKVLITKNDLYNICNDEMKTKLKNIDFEEYKDNNELLYANNKNIELSLFSNRNKFSGIDMLNQYGVNISYNHEESFASLAQEQRHRTIDTEMALTSSFKYYIPKLIKDNPSLAIDWGVDMIRLNKLFPQGQIIKVNTSASLKNIINFVGTERCCEHAQLEIEDFYLNELIPQVYYELKNVNNELATQLKPYVKKLRCAYPNYNCPNKCGHPRLNRNF